MTSSVSDQLRVELAPDRLEIEPGAAPAEVTVTIQNLGGVVEQYTVDVIGIDSEWYTAPLASVGLFPQDREQLRITFHPPKRQGQRAGAYPFQVRVRSRGGVQQQVAEGVLDVRGFAVFRLDITPRRQTGRKGNYRVQLSNSGTGDVRLALEARDAEEACAIRFPKDDTPLVPAGSRVEVPLVVLPRRRPWVGPEKSYELTVTARPHDARGQPQQVPGQFTYKPFLPSWAPFRKAAFWTIGGLAALMVFGLVIGSSLPGQFGNRLSIFGGMACGSIYRIPGINRIICTSGPVNIPPPNPNCAFEFGFKEFATTDAALVGPCTTKPAYDGFGNGLQYTTNGVLFWQKNSNTTYFITADSVYAFLQGKTELLHGPGKR